MTGERPARLEWFLMTTLPYSDGGVLFQAPDISAEMRIIREIEITFSPSTVYFFSLDSRIKEKRFLHI